MEPSLATVKTRFWSKVENTEPGTCWLWTGATTRGYGYVKNEGRATYAHIVSYQWANGLVPEGLELDHLCRISLCVNPEHLEAVTHKVNLQRGRSFNRERIACQRGHIYTKESTYITTKGTRVCRICDRRWRGLTPGFRHLTG